METEDKGKNYPLSVLVEPLQIRHGAAHVVIGNTVVRARVASDSWVGATLNDEHGVSLVRAAAARVIDENITSLDVLWRRLVLAASASPAMSAMEAITKLLCAHFLLAARIATALTTLVKRLVATSEQALAHKVGAIARVARVAAVLIAPVRPGSARGVLSLLAIVVGTVPPLLGISNSFATIISGSKTADAQKSNHS